MKDGKLPEPNYDVIHYRKLFDMLRTRNAITEKTP